MAVALPASAHSVPLDTSVSCPSSTQSAGFTDIGAFDAQTQLAINCIAAFGITTGTTATTYSPNAPVARWQMALFLVRQAADHGITIPAASSQGYTDIGGLDQATQDAINQITQLGVSKGTSTTTFSPFATVTRWQMALFLHRLGGLAGITFVSNTGHNTFSDIGSQSTEAQDAINALADTPADPSGHIALGIGGSLYAPNADVLRWQMALFLTRVLAADGVVQSGILVIVTPADTVSLSTGTTRTYQADFNNSDGTPYTGLVGVQLVDTTTGGAPIFNDTTFAAGATVGIISSSDGLGGGAAVTTITGSAGLDGIVTFTISVTGAAEQVVPVAWQDLDGDGTYETTGNVPPTEPFGVGGVTNFTVADAPEAADGAFAVTVNSTDKVDDRFESAANSFFYDANDQFQILGAAATLQQFEDALNQADTVGGTYNDDPAGQSTFNITAQNTATLTVTTPSAATTVDANTFTIQGKAHPGATVRAYPDLDNDGVIDAGESVDGTATAGADGDYAVTVPLTQSAANNFQMTQQPSGQAEIILAPNVDVPTITEAVSAGATITVAAATNGNVANVLDAGDTVALTFSEALSGVSNGDTITVLDADGTSGTITLGNNASFVLSGGNTVLTLTITAAIPVSGGSGGINQPASVTAIGGFTDDDGEAINVAGSGAGRTFGDGSPAGDTF